jgi:hypothetical protein
MYIIIGIESTFVPAVYSVFVEVAYYKNCGFKPTEKMIGRVGGAHTREAAEKLIANDKKAMGETYGGLIEPVRLKGRTYLIHKCGGWEVVS